MYPRDFTATELSDAIRLAAFLWDVYPDSGKIRMIKVLRRQYPNTGLLAAKRIVEAAEPVYANQAKAREREREQAERDDALDALRAKLVGTPEPPF